jgi:hypothetical protein
MSDYLSPGKKAWATRQANLAKIQNNSPAEGFFKSVPQKTNYVVNNGAFSSKFSINNSPTIETVGKYHYAKDSDTYITYLNAAKSSVVISGEKHRDMHKEYSAWSGKEATVNEICQKFNIPQAWFIEYKTIHGWTHDQGPFTKEELEDKPVEILVDEAISIKKKDWQGEFQKRSEKETKEAAEKWLKYEQSTLRYINNVLKDHKPYSVPQLKINPAEENYALVLPVMDLHFGKYSSPDETGQSYSRKEARNLLHFHTEKVLSRALKFGRPDKIISTVGSDFCHIDNILGTTTKGTPQDMDGTPGVILKEALELAVEHIDSLREVAPVELVLCSGNHDEYTSLALLMYLRAWYRNCEDVTVHFSLFPRNYISYGVTLMGFSHGDECKPADLTKLVPHEARELWANTENAVIYTGHKHYEYSNDDSGILIQQGSSLSAADRWHNKKGYVLSRQSLIGYIVYEQHGPGGQITSAISNNKYNK